jgi:sortase (surface protein transpeptidase)
MRSSRVSASLALAIAASLVVPADRAFAVTPPHHRTHPLHHYHRPAPWLIRIPAIGVTTTIIPTGVNRDGTVAVPSITDVQKVGWYKYGAVPGAAGPAVLFGHVDTYIGPAVFYRLYLLRRGEHIAVRAAGRSLTFAVTSLRQVSKEAFPSSVYAPGRPPVLYLVTCAGGFNYVTRHYTDNIIVTARLLVPARRHGVARRGHHHAAAHRRRRPVPVPAGRHRLHQSREAPAARAKRLRQERRALLHSRSLPELSADRGVR